MAASVPYLCVFCRSEARRLHSDDASACVIDCWNCGSYMISSELDARSRAVRDHRFLIALRRRIKPANRRGMRIDVETLVEMPLSDGIASPEVGSVRHRRAAVNDLTQDVSAPEKRSAEAIHLDGLL